MRINPEFIKSVQLVLNPVKLILMPVVLGMIFLVTYLGVEDSAEYSIQVTSLILFGVIVFGWGTKMAIESLVDEFNDKTWDSQRMTAIGPWDLACGKLFGSTLLAWYGGLLCIMVFAVFSLLDTESHHLGDILLIAIFVGTFAQSVIISFILKEFSKNRDSGKLSVSTYSIAVIIFLLILVSFLIGAYDSPTDILLWYNVPLFTIDMIFYSSIFFCAWGLIGIYRAMRDELQFENSPWVWMLFVISVMIYGSGFISNTREINHNQVLFFSFYVSFGIGIVSFYIMAFVEAKSIVDARWLLDKAIKRKWSEFFLKTPAWLVSLLLTGILCIVLVFLKIFTNLSDSPEWFTEAINYTFHSPFAVFMFCLRDIGVIIWTNLNSTKRNRDITAAFYLMIMYVLIPLVLNILNIESILPWFFPFIRTNFLNSIVPVTIQACFVFYFIGKITKLRL